MIQVKTPSKIKTKTTKKIPPLKMTAQKNIEDGEMEKPEEIEANQYEREI